MIHSVRVLNRCSHIFFKRFLCTTASSVLLLQLFDNVMSSALPDEDVYEHHHSHKRQIKPSRERCGRVCRTALSILLHRQSHLAWPCFAVEHQRLAISRPGEPKKKKNLKSLYDLEWPSLTADQSLCIHDNAKMGFTCIH